LLNLRLTAFPNETGLLFGVSITVK